MNLMNQFSTNLKKEKNFMNKFNNNLNKDKIFKEKCIDIVKNEI